MIENPAAGIMRRMLDDATVQDGDRVFAVPDRFCYPHLFNWDSGFHQMMYAWLDDPWRAAQEQRSLFAGQAPNGQLPNMQRVNSRGLSITDFDPEWWLTFKKPKVASAYTQPPVHGWATDETCKSFERTEGREAADEYLEGIYSQLRQHYSFFMNDRQNSDADPLIGNVHPSEDGMDSLPSKDGKWLIPTFGPKTIAVFALPNTVLNWGSALYIGYKQKKVDWHHQRVRDNYWFISPMFNSIVADNLGIMGNLAQRLADKTEDPEQKAQYTNDSIELGANAQKLSERVLNGLWDGDKKVFFSLSKGKRVDELTISELFPIVLPTITSEQLNSVLDLLEDSTQFKTEYGIPSVPVGNKKKYDPNFYMKRIWRGPSMPFTDTYLLMRGLFASI